MKRCLNCESTFDNEGWHCTVCGFEPDVKNGQLVFAPDLAQHNDTYTADFFAHLAELEKGHFWFEARNRILSWAVKRYFPTLETFFEIGCGTGFVLQQLAIDFPSAQLYGSDLLIEGLGFAAGRVPQAEIVQMDARNIPYVEAFDAIGAFDVIEHIAEDELALAQMYQALKPGGGLFLSVPQHPFLWSVIDELSYHKRRYKRDELSDKVSAAGFEVMKTTSFISLLLPVMLLNRARKAQQAEEFDLYAEFNLNPMLNSILSQVMRLEVLLIKSGIVFPLGGSRLLIACRPLK